MTEHTIQRSLADVWRSGAAVFLSELREQGFDPLPNRAFQALAESQDFEKILRPRAFSAEARFGAFSSQESMSYVSKDSSSKEILNQSEGWGLLFADKCFEQNDAAVFKNSASLFVKNPDAALDFVLRKIFPLPWAGLATHENPKFEGVLLEKGAIIGPNVEIGPGSVIETGVRIGARVKIGSHTRIGAYTRIADDCVLGDHCQIASHVSIGGQGFGFVKYPKQPAPLPRLHVGRAVLGSSLRLGSHVAVDRGVLEDTVIGNFSALDNHVQIAHNCIVGEHNVYCAFVGLSGSSKIGDRVTFGAMSGTKGHLEVGADSIVAGQSGVTADLAPKSLVKGYPPRPLKEALKIQVLVGRLPEFFSRLKKLEKEV